MILQQVYNKILNMVRKAYISLTNDDSADYSTIQVTYQGKQNNAQPIYPYGLNANAPEQTLIMLYRIGSEENLFGIPYACKERFRNLKKGEVTIGSPKTGSYIKFLENGDIEMYTTSNININNNKIGFFNVPAVSKQTGGALTAGGSYTVNEQNMLNKVYSALRAYGLIT